MASIVNCLTAVISFRAGLWIVFFAYEPWDWRWVKQRKINTEKTKIMVQTHVPRGAIDLSTSVNALAEVHMRYQFGGS
jgi:hypothetical protein